MLQILPALPPNGKVKHCDRLSVLKKVQDKYNWEGVNFPAALSDVERFEEHNKVCVNIFVHKGEKEIVRRRLGTIPYEKTITLTYF